MSLCCVSDPLLRDKPAWSLGQWESCVRTPVLRLGDLGGVCRAASLSSVQARSSLRCAGPQLGAFSLRGPSGLQPCPPRQLGAFSLRGPSGLQPCSPRRLGAFSLRGPSGLQPCSPRRLGSSRGQRASSSHICSCPICFCARGHGWSGVRPAVSVGWGHTQDTGSLGRPWDSFCGYCEYSGQSEHLCPGRLPRCQA